MLIAPVVTMGVFNSSLWFIKEEPKMNKNKRLRQTIKNVYNGIDSATLLSANKDGSLKVIKEERSKYSFIVRFDGSEKNEQLTN